MCFGYDGRENEKKRKHNRTLIAWNEDTQNIKKYTKSIHCKAFFNRKFDCSLPLITIHIKVVYKAIFIERKHFCVIQTCGYSLKRIKITANYKKICECFISFRYTIDNERSERSEQRREKERKQKQFIRLSYEGAK